jgi:hypothetical protein
MKTLVNTYHYSGPLISRRLLASRLTEPGGLLLKATSGFALRHN